MKEFLIPEHDDTKWVPEGGVLWLELDKKYETLFVNIPISVCTEPNPGSYTESMKKETLANIMSFSDKFIMCFCIPLAFIYSIIKR